jgi:hypothetical protein
MTAIKSFFGYSISLLAIPLVMAVFIGLGSWSALLVHGTGVKISPWFSGGEVARIVDHGTHVTRIYHPVFAGIFGQRREGFVQVDWLKKAFVPAQIDERVDLAGDGTPDFRIQWNTLTDAITLTPVNPAVIGLRSHDALSDRLVVRVNLRNSSY